MKKIILFLAILSVGFISSCSKDEDGNDATPNPNPNPNSNNVFTAKVNGVQKVFKVASAKVLEYPAYTDIEITAQMTDDPTNTFELNLSRDSGVPYFIQYSETGTYYEAKPVESFPVTINENSTKKMSGTFSGTMQETESGPGSVTITDGNFTIHF
ncbi:MULTISPECIES: hypothetical protein [Flavobacterium]|uniref:hypothetical protein n=1 Tax=Flavobacterium TaxID=237 RepID=UPI001FCBF733|nr:MULTISPECIES: hypothetical protein [Flavobacterium]UOK41935.1 hypothetical protein LZF87_11540 [Flavobacterium enshiense]